MKLSLCSSSLGPALGNGKWGSCPQEPGLRAASMEGGKKRKGKRRKGHEKERGREREIEIGMMVAAPTMYRMVTMCQTLYFCHIV